MTKRDVRTLPQLENLIRLGDTFSSEKVQKRFCRKQIWFEKSIKYVILYSKLGTLILATSHSITYPLVSSSYTLFWGSLSNWAEVLLL